jgi:hypothetical protein
MSLGFKYQYRQAFVVFCIVLCGSFGDYLAANLKVIVLVLVAVDFEVTVIVAVLSTPGVKPVIVILLSATKLEFVVVKTLLLSASLVTVTATVTPADGKVELTFTFIACEVPTTANIFPVPGSTLTEKVTGDSVGVGVGVGVGESPPLLHEKNINGITSNINFIDLI